MEHSTRREEADRPLVSIIVPVYKVEAYLERCVASIVAQTYGNIEVFLVDDGSPDRCGEMCDRFAERYDFIQVIHQVNQGQAAARNRAAKLARGTYITFIDSDDYVEPDYVEYLLALRRKYDADIAVGGFYYTYEGSTPKKRPQTPRERCLGACDALMEMNYNRGLGATPWTKLYKRELILSHPFPEGQIYEDLATMYKILGDSERVALGNRKIYYWVQRAGSTMRMEFDERQMAGIAAVEAQLAYVEERYPQALPSVKFRYVAKAVELIAVCFGSGGSRQVFQRLRAEVNRFAPEVMRDKRAKTSMKLRITAVRLGYYPAKLAFRLHEDAKKRRMG